MYLFVIISSLLKSFSPYLRKHILVTFESHEYLFVNTFFVSLFIFLFFLYKSVFHNKTINQFFDKLTNLTIVQVIIFSLIALITVISSFFIIHLDKYFNTPLINSIITKGVATIILLVTGIFIYKEKYNYKQILGIIMTILGLFLINCKN